MEIISHVELHPLAISSTCDHYTRVTLGGSKLPQNSPVFGLLFGEKLNNQEISIVDGTEGVIEQKAEGGEYEINVKALQKKINMWIEVFPLHQFVGFYLFGDELNDSHKKYFEQMFQFSKTPVLLLLKPDEQGAPSSSKLPVKIFGLGSDGQSIVEIPFKLQTSHVERISVDFVLKSIPREGITAVEVQNQSLVSSLDAIQSRIDILIKALEEMKSGNGQVNNELLRTISKICNNLPISNEEETDSSYLNQEVSNTLMSTILATITSNLSTMADLHDLYNFNSNSDKKVRGG